MLFRVGIKRSFMSMIMNSLALKVYSRATFLNAYFFHWYRFKWQLEP